MNKSVLVTRNTQGLGGIETVSEQLEQKLNENGYVMHTLSIGSEYLTDIKVHRYRSGMAIEVPTYFRENWYSSVPATDKNPTGNFNFVNSYAEKVGALVEKLDPNCIMVNATNDMAYLLAQVAQNLDRGYSVAVHGLHYKEKDIGHTKPEEFILDGAKQIAYVSNHAKTTLEAEIGRVFNKPSQIIYNGLNPVFFQNYESEIGGSIGFSGRNSPVKGFDLMLKLIEQYTRNGGGEQFKLICPGYSKELPSSANLQKPFIDDVMGLAGFVSSLGCMVSPSTFETAGLAPLEAILTGTPAVISPTMGAKEILNELDLGYLVAEKREVGSFINAIDNVLVRGRIPMTKALDLQDFCSDEKMVNSYLSFLDL